MKVKEMPTCVNCGAPLKGLKCEYCGTEYDGFIDAENLKQKIEIENKIIDNQSRMNELRLKIAQNQQAAILQQILGYGISYNTVIRAFEDFWGNET